jgi:translation initiation factor eIF-2B subunit gamma
LDGGAHAASFMEGAQQQTATAGEGPSDKQTVDSDDEPLLHGVYVEVAAPGQYARRVGSVAAYMEANREVASKEEAQHLSGLKLSRHDNAVHATVTLGSKATVGSACIVGERCVVGDKAAIKRCVLGRDVTVGAAAKLMGCVVGDGVRIEDGVLLQGCVVCAGAVLREKCSLRDCQVAAGFEVEAGAELRDEELLNE